jgi:hypothetical protein
MYQRIIPRWQAKLAKVRELIPPKEAELATQMEQGQRDAAAKELVGLQGQAKWMEETLIKIIISEGQNEVADFKKWGVDIIPHRLLMKQGFETANEWMWSRRSRTRTTCSEHIFFSLVSSSPCCLTSTAIRETNLAHSKILLDSPTDSQYGSKTFTIGH